MATQYKKIQNKVHPKKAAEVKESLKPKASRDALMLVLIAVTALVMVLGWNTMDDIGHAMYSSLVVGMVAVYLNRRMHFPEKVHKFLIALSSTLLVVSVGLLFYNMYVQFMK